MNSNTENSWWERNKARLIKMFALLIISLLCGSSIENVYMWSNQHASKDRMHPMDYEILPLPLRGREYKENGDLCVCGDMQASQLKLEEWMHLFQNKTNDDIPTQDTRNI